MIKSFAKLSSEGPGPWQRDGHADVRSVAELTGYEEYQNQDVEHQGVTLPGEMEWNGERDVWKNVLKTKHVFKLLSFYCIDLACFSSHIVSKFSHSFPNLFFVLSSIHDIFALAILRKILQKRNTFRFKNPFERTSSSVFLLTCWPVDVLIKALGHGCFARPRLQRRRDEETKTWNSLPFLEKA